MIKSDILSLSYKERLDEIDDTIAVLDSHIKNNEIPEANELIASLLEQTASLRTSFLEAEPYKTAISQYEELKTLLTERGILSLTDRKDFISQVWALPIENPTRADDTDIAYVDFNFKDISATLSWSIHEKNPQLSPYIDIWVEGYEEPIDSFNAEKGE